jgi:outer membrane protein TolC
VIVKKYILLLSISLPLLAGSAKLTLPEAIEIVKENNLEIKIAQFDTQMKDMESKLPDLGRLGKLDATISAMRSSDAGNVFGFKLQSREASFGDFGAGEFNPANPNVLSVQPYDLNYPQARNHFLTKFTYSLPLYTSGKISSYSAIAKNMYDMSKIDKNKVIAQKIFETKKTFYDITLVENYISNLKKISSNIGKMESIVKNMAKEGYAIKTDLLEVQAHKAEAESMLIQAKLNRELAYQFLSFLLNRDVDSIKKVNEKAPLNIPVDNTIQNENFDIQKAIIGLKITEDAIRLQKSNFGPVVGGFAEYGSADNTPFNDFEHKSFYTIGLQANWNIFNGFIDKINMEKSKVEFAKTQSQVELAISGTKLKAKKIEVEAKSELAIIKSYEKQFLFASRVYENYLAKYSEGMISISEVLKRQSKELEILLKLLESKNKYNAKVFELNSLTVKGVE